MVERGFFSAGGEIRFSPAREKKYLPASGVERQNLRREESVAQKGIRQRLIGIEERMNSSSAFWLNFRKIDVDGRVLLQILIDGKDALLTEELDSFLKNAAADMLYLIRAYRKLRTQLAEERREAKIILRELRDELEQLKTKGAGEGQ
tara:strand:- start:500 stop:943 length:444 start_codon:yes stop_codon:yes gene_type:complete